MPMDVDTHLALSLDQPAPAEANGHSNKDVLAALNTPGDAIYHPCPEADPGLAVPRGEVLQFEDWQETEIYAHTKRNLYIYRTPGFDPERPSKLICCNDGVAYVMKRGAVRAPLVMDALHASGELEQAVGIFINPGSPPPDLPPVPSHNYDEAATQRCEEYDSVTPVYGDFLLQVIPFAEAQLGTSLSNSPDQRIACGISSGGICAFTTAWFHTEAFGNVLSHCGSFTNIRGGHNYPYLIRTTPRKPLRALLTSGENDAGTLFGDWPLANKAMANALAYAGYEHRFEFGTGGHNLRHGGAIFADSLRWLWQLPSPAT